MQDPITLADLRQFVTTAEELHFGRAAERLHVAQPALSRRIRTIEHRLGAAMFERTNRRVTLTRAGETLLRRARAILDDVSTTVDDVRRVADGKTGQLTVGSGGAATFAVVTGWLTKHRARFPDVDLKLVPDKVTADLVTELEAAHIDVAVLRPPVSSAAIVVHTFGEEDLIAVLPASSPWCSHQQVRLADLREEPFIFTLGNSPDRNLVYQACLDSGFQPNIVAEANETLTLLALVASGHGVALAPSSVRDIGLPGVEYRPLRSTGPVVRLPLSVAWRRDNDNPVLPGFLRLVREDSELSQPQPPRGPEAEEPPS